MGSTTEAGTAHGQRLALLDSGERVILHDERGYSGKSFSGGIWSHETVETITRNVFDACTPRR